ncbi:transcriptional regulator, LysR family [Vibrio xiamenensis]|uniref:Transcriptional regulator, LysR family n=1 Tax=Vibrio xiamenensis TaxID=861298 RepID=A0A1G8A4N6_9VIBR|nr:LysR family transcriptional regulator [Vibrio xiamenensis]SDH15904.1 transcriptional regulator, LysR family [Vibrio xiamenensis]
MDRIVGMKVFVEVVNLGSLTAAANKLGISKSMATRHISALEHSFGVKLLHRSSRSLSMTNSGESILPYCKQILAVNDDITYLTSLENTEPHGTVRLACSVSFGHSYVATAVRRFLKFHPKVAIELILTDRQIDPVKERFDATIQIGNAFDNNLVARLIGRCSSLISASPIYLSKHPEPQAPVDLMTHNCLTHTGLGNIWRLLPQTSKETDERIEVSTAGNFTSNDSMMLLQATLDGEGVSCLPDFVVKPHIKNGQLRHLISDYSLEQQGVYLLYPAKKYLTHAVHQLIDFLINDFNNGQFSRQM